MTVTLTRLLDELSTATNNMSDMISPRGTTVRPAKKLPKTRRNTAENPANAAPPPSPVPTAAAASAEQADGGQDTHATRIQAAHRGKMARRKLEADLTERGDAGKLALLRDAQANKKGANDGGAEAVALFEGGVRLLGAGSLDEARDSFQAAVDGNPPHPRPSRCYNGLGLVQLGLGDPDAAVLAFTKAIELDPIDYRALHNRAEAHKRAGNFSAAAADAASAAALNSNAATSAASKRLLHVAAMHRAAQRFQAVYRGRLARQSRAAGTLGRVDPRIKATPPATPNAEERPPTAPLHFPPRPGGLPGSLSKPSTPAELPVEERNTPPPTPLTDDLAAFEVSARAGCRSSLLEPGGPAPSFLFSTWLTLVATARVAQHACVATFTSRSMLTPPGCIFRRWRKSWPVVATWSRRCSATSRRPILDSRRRIAAITVST